MDEVLVPATQVLDALGIAWTIHGLYPDPTRQPAFRRALESISQSVTEPVVVEVRGGGFAVGGDPVEITREGTERLARRLFLHGVETLRVEKAPRHEEVVHLFELLAKEEGEIQRGGGVEAAMLRHGIESFSVTERPPLMETPTAETVERDEGVVRVLEEGADPEQFAKGLLAETGEDPRALAEVFTSRYADVYQKVAEEDVSGREEVVRVFVEAFFYLPDPHQVAVFEVFLEHKDREEHQVFLDQFAGHELARLAPSLDPRGFSLLLEYARISTDQADKRPDELLGLLESPEGVEHARRAVVAGMQQRMDDVEESAVAAGESFDNLRSRVPDPTTFFYKTLEVFRGLLEVEHRSQRFERLLRIWSGKIATSVRRREFRRAELWLRAATDHPTYPEERAAEVTQTLAQLGTPEVIEVLIGRLAEGREGEAQARLLQALGPQAVDSVVELLGTEKEPGRRRTLMEVLTVAAQKDPAPLIAHLGDERWYVVRNLAVVLGKIGRPEVVNALAGLMRHDDHRVRVEALRSLTTILGGSGVEHLRAALDDAHERVRQTAVGLLGSAGTERATAALVEALDAPRLQPAEKRRVIGFLAQSGSSAAKDALEEVAERRFLFSAAKRQLRDAAREALAAAASGRGPLTEIEEEPTRPVGADPFDEPGEEDLAAEERGART